MVKVENIEITKDDIDFFMDLLAAWGLECIKIVYDKLAAYHDIDGDLPSERKALQHLYKPYCPTYKVCRKEYKEIYRKKRLHYLAHEFELVDGINARAVDLHAQIQAQFGKADFNELQGLYLELTKHLSIELSLIHI